MAVAPLFVQPRAVERAAVDVVASALAALVIAPSTLELAAVRVGAAVRRVRQWNEQSAGECNNSLQRPKALQHEHQHLRAASLPLVVEELALKHAAISITAFAFAVAARAVAPHALECAAVRIGVSVRKCEVARLQSAGSNLTTTTSARKAKGRTYTPRPSRLP